MPVISFVTPKGGAGKSTSALLLATELATKGATVTIIDGDAEQWIYQWGQGGNVPPTMQIIAQPSEDTIIDEIERAAEKTSFVIVDLEGTANMVVAYAISRSDLVIVPTQPSTMDGKSAAKAIKLVKQQERGFQKRIPFAVLLTRTSAVIQSKTQRNLTAQLEASDIPVFQTQLLERNAFKSIFDFSCTLEDLPKSTYKLNDAIANARSFAGEVIAMFRTRQSTDTQREEAAA